MLTGDVTFDNVAPPIDLKIIFKMIKVNSWKNMSILNNTLNKSHKLIDQDRQKHFSVNSHGKFLG